MSDAAQHLEPTRAAPPTPLTGNSGWERLDAPAAIPRSGVGTAAIDGLGAGTRAGTSSGSQPLRLRRSRSLVLAALDTGGSVLQRHGRTMLVGSSLLLLPVVAFNLWVTGQIFDQTGATRLTAFGGDDVGTGIEDVAAMLAVVCASFAASVVGCFAAIVLIADRFGTAVTLRPALVGTMRRLPTIVVAWVIGHAWVPFLATWSLASRSGQVAGRLFVVALFAACFASITLFVVPVVVAEGLGPFAALRRSWRLMRSRTGPVFGFVGVSTIVGGLLSAGIAYLPALAEVAGFLTFGDFLWIVQGVASQLAVIIVIPLIALATAHLYLLVRVDAEGLDIATDADAAFGPSEAAARAPGASR